MGVYHLRWQTEIDMKEKSKNKIKKWSGTWAKLGLRCCCCTTVVVKSNWKRKEVPEAGRHCQKELLKNIFLVFFYLFGSRTTFWGRKDATHFERFNDDQSSIISVSLFSETRYIKSLAVSNEPSIGQSLPRVSIPLIRRLIIKRIIKE